MPSADALLADLPAGQGVRMAALFGRLAGTRLMNPVIFGVVAGLLFGILDVSLMIPMDFPDKKTAFLGAFLSRFAIGFLIPLVKMPLPPIVIGGLVGLLISLPDAVITKAYAPILATGLIGGLVIGWAAGRFAA
jgi:hypothetical protein